MIRKLINYLSGTASSTDGDLENQAKLSEEAVSNIAGKVGAEENWLPKYVQKSPVLKKENGKLLWTVVFVLETEDGFLLIGPRKSLIIDDETGLVIRKIVGSR